MLLVEHTVHKAAGPAHGCVRPASQLPNQRDDMQVRVNRVASSLHSSDPAEIRGFVRKRHHNCPTKEMTYGRVDRVAVISSVAWSADTRIGCSGRSEESGVRDAVCVPKNAPSAQPKR